MNGADRTFDFTNARNSVVPTGIFMGSPQSLVFLAVFLLLVLGIGLGAGMTYRRHRRSR
jgi:hypothetical protein